MISIDLEIRESCDFLRRFLAGERGFITNDVLAGIIRLREVHSRCTNVIDRGLAMQLVRQSCEKLGRKDDNYRWACAG